MAISPCSAVKMNPRRTKPMPMPAYPPNLSKKPVRMGRASGQQSAKPPPLCVSPDCSDPSCHQTNQGTQTQRSFSGPALEEPALVLRAVSVAHRSPMTHSPETVSPLSSEQNDVASKGPSCGLCTFGLSMGARRPP